jgi:rare lipoprotein A
MKKSLLSCLLSLSVSIAVTSTCAAIVHAEPTVRGLASWYGPECSGNHTANGELFDPQGLTAAHHSLPFGTRVRVTNEKTGRSVVVRINDRLGDPGIVIDLAKGAAQAIGLTETAPVKLELLSSSSQ